jgi:chorismate dehydratase
MSWRLGVVPYLNADPLAAALVRPDAEVLVGEPIEVRALVPSELIGALLAGEVDAALVSTAAVLPHPELVILPDMGITSRGPVRSIQLYCTRPVHEVRTVALDASSRSAHALTRVLFAEKWRTQPEFRVLPPHLPSMLEECDAALLIGNPALLANEMLSRGEWRGPELSPLDLGQVWDELTGLPFVYAPWAAARIGPDGRPKDLDGLMRLLLRAKKWGMPRREMLAERGAAALGVPYAVTLDYLTQAIRYDLGEAERAGMERFCEMAVRQGILPRGSAVRLHEAPPVPATAS